jgi:hypothetical protein
VGLTARTIPLVFPRAHVCITLFFGNKERYLEYFYANPGVYFKTTGWIERGDGLAQFGPQTVQQQAGMTQTYEEHAAPASRRGHGGDVRQSPGTIRQVIAAGVARVRPK